MDPLSETTQARREWSEILQVLREKRLPAQKSISSEIVLKREGEMKTFSDKQKWKKFMANRLALQDMLKEDLRAEEKQH